MKKRILISLTGAVVSGVILNLILPSILLVASSLSTSVGTIVDPLHSDDHLEDVWFSVVIIISLITIFAFAASIFTGLVVAFVSSKIFSGWSYFISAAASLVIHQLLLAMLVYAILFTAAEAAPPGMAFYSFFAVSLTASAVGLVGCYFSRQVDRNT